LGALARAQGKLELAKFKIANIWSIGSLSLVHNLAGGWPSLGLENQPPSFAEFNTDDSAFALPQIYSPPQ
jgi:hypothetical protein